MSKVIRLFKQEVNPKELDRLDRIKATKGLVREAWFVIFWPFGLFGAMFGWAGFGAGCFVGLLFFAALLLEMRYGKEL